MDQLDIPQDNNEDVVDLFVPDINSSDPEERKLARKIRIKKRLDALARQKKAKEQTAEKPQEKVTLLQIQLEKSSEVLQQLFQEAEEQVTNVRVANDCREVDRRDLESVGREKMYKQLQEDANLSIEMFQEISSKWKPILSSNDPLDIYEKLQEQKEKCEELIRQKDSVIAMLRNEIRESETKFYLDQHLQNEDIRMLANRVEKQVTIMRAAHAVELQNIEEVMIQERTNMMENNDIRWNELYKRREEQELAISKNKLKQRQEFEDVVAEVRTKHYENVREVKISLERDCDRLQQEFEYVKACALTNSEKMDYNYQILKKREGENIVIKSNQKRMLNKLQDNINILKKKIRNYEQSSNQQISKICEEILSLQKCISNEKAKSKTIAQMNDKKYAEIWELNRATATKLLNKILTIDRLLSEQQLGIAWEEPHLKLLIKEKLPSYRAAMKIINKRQDKDVSKSELNKQSFKQVDEELDNDTKIGYCRVLKNVFQRIADKSGFLIEVKMAKIFADTSAEENVLVKVDNVFEALGIETPEDINVMLHFFRPYIHCPICNTNSSEENSRTESVTATSIASILTGPDGMLHLETPGMSNNMDYDVNTLACRESDNAVDNIVASIVDPKKLKDSSSELNLVRMEGECLGPSKTNQEVEKKVAQVDNYVTVIDDNSATNCLQSHPIFMNPASVLRALREFVTKVMCTSEDKDGTDSTPDAQITPTVSRLLDQREVKEYWDRYKAIISTRTTDWWKALFYGLKKYHAILEDRHKLNNELKQLDRQNRELTFLLAKVKNEQNQTK